MAVIKSIHLSTLVWVVFIIMAVMLLLEGTAVTTGLFKPCGSIVTVLGLVLLIFDKWAWSWRWFHPWFVDRPYVKGTWKGQLISSYINPATNQPVPPIEVYLVIRQTYSAIHLRLITKESSSESLANNIPAGEDGVYSIASVYRNTPQLAHRGRSPIHHGAMLLRVEGDPVVSLSGEYWTDRTTHGEIRFTEKSETLYYTFDAAAAGRFTPLNSLSAASSTAATPPIAPTV
jgi:hypothetical protein